MCTFFVEHGSSSRAGEKGGETINVQLSQLLLLYRVHQQVRRIRIALAKKFKKEPENGVRVYFRIVAESNRHAIVFNSCDSIKVAAAPTMACKTS